MKSLYFICIISVIFGVQYVMSNDLNNDLITDTLAQQIPVINISIYYETHSRECQSFILQQLYPTFCRVKDYVELNFVPFGKARSLGNHLVCRHGPKECQSIVIHNCVLRRIESSSTKMNYVKCALRNPDLPGHMEDTCVREVGLSVHSVKRCMRTGESYTLLTMAQVETRIMTYGPISVPTIVFDDKYSDRNQRLAVNDFEGILCEKFKKLGLYDICSNGMILRQGVC